MDHRPAVIMMRPNDDHRLQVERLKNELAVKEQLLQSQSSEYAHAQVRLKLAHCALSLRPLAHSHSSQLARSRS
jgi:hypothetical protein